MRKKRDVVQVNRTKYTILRSYGHRKDGYLYLVSNGETMFMLKEYDENILSKVEQNYNTLHSLGIPMPKLIEMDQEKKIIIKECIDGKSAYTLLQNNKLYDTYLDQLRNMASIVETKGICIDYFPTQFVCENNILYYTHYGIVEGKEENTFQACVKKYWIERNGLHK